MLNGCARQQRSFKLLNKTFREGQETARRRLFGTQGFSYNLPFVVQLRRFTRIPPTQSSLVQLNRCPTLFYPHASETESQTNRAEQPTTADTLAPA